MVKIATMVGLLLSAAALSGCRGPGADPSQERERTGSALSAGLTVTPADGATGAPINSPVSAAFAVDMTGATINKTSFTLASASGAVDGAVTYDDASRTAVFAPSALLANNTQYRATLTSDVQDLTRQPLTLSTWSFTTARAESTPPAVLATMPAIGAALAPNSALAVTFTEAVMPATIDKTTFTVALVGGSSPIDGNVAYDDASHSAIFSPAVPLAANASYSASVGPGVQDLAGNVMAQKVAWTFTTTAESDHTLPTVTFTSPQGTQVPASSPISAVFSKPIDPRTVNATTFTLQGASGAVSGTVAYDPNTRAATFTPATALSHGLPYNATIASGVRDLAGNMTQSTSWTFTLAVRYLGLVSNINADRDEHVKTNANAWWGTRDNQGLGLRWDITREGDHWKYRYQLSGAEKGVSKWVNSFCIGAPDGFESTDLLAGWSLIEPVNLVLVDGALHDGVLTDVTAILTRPGSAEAHAAVSGLPTSAGLFGIRWQMSDGHFQEDIANTMFILTFSTRRAPAWGDVLIESPIPSGNGLPTAWNTHLADSTDAPIADGNNGGWVLVPGIPGPDTEPPGVRFTEPAQGAAGLSIHGSISAAFSEAIDSATLIGTRAFSLADEAGAPSSGTVTYDPLTYVARFTPSVPLSYGRTYTASLGGAKDLAGYTMVPVTWTFTTESPDTTLPRVLTVSPTDGEVDVAVGVTVTAAFSEAIDPSNLGAKFTLGGVNGTATYAPATNTVAFTPAAPLAYNTAYTATVAGVSDLSGNVMVGAALSWTFTISAPPPYVPSGDVNGDGLVDIEDTRLALKIAAGEVAATSAQLRAGDVAPLVNGAPSPNAKIDVGDVLVILRKVAGQESW